MLSTVKILHSAMLFNVIAFVFFANAAMAQSPLQEKLSQLRHLYETGQNREALSLAMNVRQRLRTLPDADKMYLVEVDTKIVGIHKRLGTHEDGLPFAIEAVEILRAMGATEDFSFGVANINAAFLFREVGNFEEEVRYFEVAFSVLESLAKENKRIVPIMQKAGQELAKSYRKINSQEKLDILVEKMEKFN